MSQKFNLSQTEEEIMEAFWNRETPFTPTGLLEYFPEKGWKRQTISTFLSSLMEKGLLLSEKKGREVFYSAKLTKKQFQNKKTVGFFDSICQGSVKHFMSALFEENKLTKEDLSQLKDWLESQEEEDKP